MGILNVTPDSFFDGGNYLSEENIIQKVNSMEYHGAKIIDVGGYSSRPNATPISEEEELKRIVPIIKLVKTNFPDLLISVDTFRSKVAEKSIEAGANIINDISGGNMDSNMFRCIADLKVPYVLMHMQGTPQTMQENPTYQNVVEEVNQFFTEKLNQLTQLGVKDIILDPGFGFGKTLKHNYELLNNLDKFKTFNLPILVGFSRKSMINKVIDTTPEEALNGTTVLNTIALMKGANILRVHDVKEANETIKLVNQLNLK
ncbi:MAG: dihydropteroate synthase [Flavobacteriales bacterium CG_4_9_14_3_um_filter_32_8]|nr:MAG: dihydropteroate synthase [Flavobacteriales bacterium CG_4_9_14_3_um_filter_32_8]